MQQGASPARDIRHYLGVVWRHKFLLLAIVVLIPAGVYGISKTLPPSYVSSTTLQVRDIAVTSSLFTNNVNVSASNSEDAARIIETTLVANLAAEELGERRSSAGGLLGQIEATVETNESGAPSQFLTITATDEEPERAADIANAFGEAIATRRTDQSVEAIDEAIKILSRDAAASNDPEDRASNTALAEQIQELRGLRATQQDTTTVLEPAVPAGAPTSPQPRRNTVLAFIFSLLLAAGLVPLLDRLDRRLRTPAEIEDLTGEPLLALIPTTAFPGHVASGAVREAFQTLRASLTYFNVDRSLNAVVVTSAGHGEGKTTVATNLAVAMAMDERSVILIDGDFRRPQVPERLGIDPGAGIEAVLLGDTPVMDALVEVPLNLDLGNGSLRVLPCTMPLSNPSVLLGSKRMRDVISELAADSDIVIIDTPPVLAVSDVIPLLEDVSGTVMVARLDYSTRDSLTKAFQIVEAARGSVLGAVATGATSSGLYAYGYGYGYEDAALSIQPGANGAASNGTGKTRKGLGGVLRRSRS